MPGQLHRDALDGIYGFVPGILKCGLEGRISCAFPIYQRASNTHMIGSFHHIGILAQVGDEGNLPFARVRYF